MLENDNTKRSTSVQCPRKYQLQYIQNIFNLKGSTALRYGSVWHKCLEGFYTIINKKGWEALAEAISAGGEMAKKAWKEETDKREFWDDYRTLQNMMKSFVAYLEFYHGDEGFMKILNPEQVFKILITPTQVEQKVFPGIESFYFTGQIDLGVELTGRKWIKEHKSTGWHLGKAAQSLHRSPQLMGYNYATKILHPEGEAPDGSLVSFHHLSAYKSKKTGEYGKPKIDFSRIPHIFSEADLAAWRLAFVNDTYQLQQYFKNQVFPERLDSCYTYGACTYINICEARRGVGNEPMHGFYVDDDPWDVLKGKEDRLYTVESVDDIYLWNDLQMQLLGW